MKNFAKFTREERIKTVMEKRKLDLVLVLENLKEDLNISAILRNAEAFGVGVVCIVHSKDKRPKISKGAASGASKWLTIKYYTSIKKCLSSLKKQNFMLVGALVDPDAEVLWEQSFKGKIAVVLGNEAAGMSAQAQKLVDKNIYLPMFGLTESLNVSVAAGIFLYEVVRQKEKV